MSAIGNVNIGNQQRPVDLIAIAQRGQQPSGQTEQAQGTFRNMFSQELAASNRVVISKHAQARLHSRGIELSDAHLQKLSDAIDKADQKGARETLVLSDEAAYVVSVKNRTVITAFDPSNLRDGVVTKIDSAVIL
jgi:flagellar operon protein